jgi:hypothetical protein
MSEIQVNSLGLMLLLIAVLLFKIYLVLRNIQHLHHLDRLERPEIEAFNYRSKRPDNAKAGR